MPATDSPAVLVARFLNANNYDETLDAFIKEAGLPQDAGTQQPGDLTIEKVLQEKKVFDLSVNFEKVGLDSSNDKWTVKAPSIPIALTTLPTSSNLLYVSLEDIRLSGNALAQYILATSADRRLSMIKPQLGDFSLVNTSNQIHDSPILFCVVVRNRWLISTSMSGQVALFDCLTQTVLETRRDHSKYVVKATTWEDEHGAWVLTAGWDSKVFLYRMKWSAPHSNNDHDNSINDSNPPVSLGAPVAFTSLQSNPEHVQFIHHHDSPDPILLVSRRDSTFLYYYAIPSEGMTAEPAELVLLGKQNLAPHSNAWVAFTPSSVAVCPTDSALVAVGTSSVPHMKLIIARLLLPQFPEASTAATDADQPAQYQSHAAQAMAELAVQEREDAAILTHVSTLAPQTPYSTPQVCWRPDGSGVWVNGDDGVIRGVEAKTGKIVSTLKSGHEPGTKVRSIWAGWVDVNGQKEEWLMSGGFDRKLVVWRSSEAVDNGSS
ncbi:hypothetical protein L228DRAFT_258495 [Xylona heveae TC161]|uniref:Uncharacterized protein n=1 Tax=Xylona heveae (strain CBS 132557 / TC161) TaxID=1328760 RepID=A0A165IK98_XYLHT|nr:hypothetical protein L228DRAFT_258495 [Xylona heveae TC161]KZF25014.1 hypothetical protein L228DRAFT_258495 [Xylona heveae TC161]